MKNSRYNLLHVFVVVLCLGPSMFAHGFKAYWQQFVYGVPQHFTPDMLLKNMLGQTAYFAAMLLILWGSTFIPRLLHRLPALSHPPSPIPHPSSPIPHPSSLDRRQAIGFTLKIAVPVILVALGLNALGSKTIEWLAGVQPSEQELVKCFLDPAYPVWTRIFMVFSVAILAPVCEELIFRGVLFRGLAKKLPLVAAMLVSGFIFSMVHINAASFVAVWFLGVVFAWLYARTRTILAPMTMHAIFNLANVVMLVLFPGLAK